MEESTVSYSHHCTGSIRLEMFIFSLVSRVKLAFSWPQSEDGWILPPCNVLYLRLLYTFSNDAVGLDIRYLSSLIMKHKYRMLQLCRNSNQPFPPSSAFIALRGSWTAHCCFIDQYFSKSLYCVYIKGDFYILNKIWCVNFSDSMLQFSLLQFDKGFLFCLLLLGLFFCLAL